MITLILVTVFHSYEFQHLSFVVSGNGLLALLASLNVSSGHLPHHPSLDLHECGPMDEKGMLTMFTAPVLITVKWILTKT